MPTLDTARRILPGLAASAAVGAVALLIEYAEIGALSRPWIDGLVIAIVLGTLLHTAFGMPARLKAGIDFAAKMVLELAIVLLGATISFAAIRSAGLYLVGGIVAVVFLSLAISYGIGRLFGLSDRMATLIACGNSICGNSAIVAAAPVIKAESDEVASSIAFTAALGILVVVLLPTLQAQIGIDQRSYGILAGMTVYAVPQVIAATLPVGAISAQVGTLVKLVRVLMLGPVILLLGVKTGCGTSARLPLKRLVPWFIVGFAAMLVLRSLELIPDAALPAIGHASTVLTLVAMAALGLSVNIRTVAASGGKVLAVGVLSLMVLATISTAILLLVPVGG